MKFTVFFFFALRNFQNVFSTWASAHTLTHSLSLWTVYLSCCRSDLLCGAAFFVPKRPRWSKLWLTGWPLLFLVSNERADVEGLLLLKRAEYKRGFRSANKIMFVRARDNKHMHSCICNELRSAFALLWWTVISWMAWGQRCFCNLFPNGLIKVHVIRPKLMRNMPTQTIVWSRWLFPIALFDL